MPTIATDGAFTYPSSSYGGATVVSAVSTNCTGAVASGACELLLPPMSGYRYRVDVHNMSAKDAAEGKTPLDVRKRAAARFLIHTTFGPTRQEVTNLTAWLGSASASSSVAGGSGAGGSGAGGSEVAVFEQWIRAQMALPPSLHRAFYRTRANPRPADNGRMACEVITTDCHCLQRPDGVRGGISLLAAACD